jgi:hypothetical protein
MKITLSEDVMPYSLVQIRECFWVTCGINFQNSFAPKMKEVDSFETLQMSSRARQMLVAVRLGIDDTG